MTTLFARLNERQIVAKNLRRLLIRYGMSQTELVEASGVNERTIRGILSMERDAHAKTLHKIAAGLGIDEAEFYRDRDREAAQFDRDTNRIVAEFVQEHPQLFLNWSDEDFQDLYSRFGAGGALTEEGILAAVQTIERRREVLKRVAMLMDTSRAREIEGIVGLMYAAVTDVG